MARTESPAQTSPAEMLARIQDRFRELGIFGQSLSLTYQADKYLVSCDARTFAVYRLVEKCHVPPGRPGWPVCLVTGEVMVDETSPPHVPEDEFSSGLTMQGWLDLIDSLYG
ncbi:MAG: hypothetical protein WC600_03120 [Desulfobaccales bacterium]